MRTNCILAVFGLFIFGTLSSSGRAAELAQPPDYAAAKASFRVIEATWGARYKGSKTEHSANVADRVTYLLMHQGHFWVKTGPLHSDPWPYHFKFLYLRYQVLDVIATVILHEDHEVTLRKLIKHSMIRPPHMDDIPPEL